MLPYPDLNIRLTLAASQMLVYHERFEPSTQMLALYSKLFNTGVAAGVLHPTYVKKVRLDFVSAAKIADGSSSAGGGGSGSSGSGSKENGGGAGVDGDGDGDGEDEDDEVMAAALDAVLDAEAGGYGDFEDDFDDAGEGVAVDDDYSESDEEDFDPEEAAAAELLLGGGGGGAAEPDAKRARF